MKGLQFCHLTAGVFFIIMRENYPVIEGCPGKENALAEIRI